MKIPIQKVSVTILIVLSIIAFSCKNQVKTGPSKANTDPHKDEVVVATYYFPNWGPFEDSEWERVHDAKPRFEGHQQPKVPLWGYTNENEPRHMAQKIDAAADHGLDVFIFDWYFADLIPGPTGEDEPYGWSGSKYLYMALEEGFLQAPNNDRMKFSLMWCNHNLGQDHKGAVKPETFENLTDYVIDNYFCHPSYWKIDGCPYFSIYQMNSFLETYGNDYNKVAEAIEEFRAKVKAAGFPDLHLNGVLWGLKDDMEKTIEELGINSTTTYVWIHHNNLPDTPATEYTKAADAYFKCVESGGGVNGLENPASEISVPYHINVSMGWDSSPRCRDVPDSEWMERSDYPFGPVMVNNAPDSFKKYLVKAKEMTLSKPENERIITINSWNEWGEGSYLEPDTINGMEYLKAIKEVFGDK